MLLPIVRTVPIRMGTNMARAPYKLWYKYGQIISPNTSHIKNCTYLKLDEGPCIITPFSFSDSRIYLSNSFRILIFLCRDETRRRQRRRRRRRKRERPKSNNRFRFIAKQQLCSCIIRFFVHFFAVVARRRRKQTQDNDFFLFVYLDAVL